MEEGVYLFPEGGSYQEFIEHCLLQNEPCLLGDWATRSWGARTTWAMKDGSPNFTYLRKEFGHAKVPVADCTGCYFSTHPKTEMTFTEYLQYWQSFEYALASQNQSRSHNLSQCNKSNDHNSPTLEAISSSPCDSCCDSNVAVAKKLLYLKDWHFFQQFPEQDGISYSVHPFMRSDWLNEVWGGRQDVTDDYKFVYMGPAGTWTPFHADVLRSFSWSANITGSKEWLLFRPKQEDELRDKFGHLPFDVTSDEIMEMIEHGRVIPPVRVIQKTGEIIFVPSGWHHQVRNLEPTISINHNWSNAFSLRRMWCHLEQELQLVSLELQDCLAMEDWHQHCQVVLKASAGMNYWEFSQFIVMLATSRLHQFEELVETECSSSESVMANTYTRTLNQFIKTHSQHKLSFFNDGIFPANLSSQPVPDDLTSSLDAQSCFEKLLCMLPIELRQVVEGVRCKGQQKHSVFVFRAFEVYMLSSVAEEVTRALHYLDSKQ